MKARLALALALLVATSVPAFALGLGEIELNSALNQRLDATIHLVSVSRNELDSLQVGLASVDAFKRYKIERTAALSGLAFKVVPDGKGGAYVHVTSKDPIRDPFLTFLVEADWSNGRLLRQYTVLLDPPTFAENKPEPAQAAAPVSSQPQAQEKRRTQPESEIRTTGTVVSTPEETQAPPTRHAMPRSTQPGTYGRIERGETLWGIARKLHQQSGASVNQMMVALYQANQSAFMGNMNRMKEGSILRIPKQDAVSRISRSDATQFVKDQDQAWRGGRSASASSASGTSAQSGGGSQAGSEKLTLVAPGGEEAASESAAQGAGTGKVSKDDLLKLQNELADTKAELANSKSNNSELQAKVDDLQGEVDRVRKLLSVKDDQLLALQQQVQQAGMQPAVKPEQAESGQAATAAGAESQSQTPPAQGEQETAAPETQQPAAAESGQTEQAGEPESGAAQQAAPEESQPAAQEQEQPAEQQPAQSEQTTPAQSTPAPKRREPGMIETLLDFLLQPMVLIGILIVVVLIGGLVFISRRQHGKAPTGVRGSQWVIAEEDETPSSEDDTTAEETAAAESADSGQAPGEAAEDGHVDTLVGGKPVNLDEDDPLSEADFHMAYGLYDQAAEGLKQAIQREPDRADLQLKLLEVYFTAGNAEAFVNAAGDAKGVLGEGSDDWGKAVIMGKQIAPEDPMFADVGTSSGVDLDFSSEDVGLESSGAPEPEPAAETEFDVSMDFDTGGEEEAPAAEESTAGEPARSGKDEMLEFDIGEFGTDTGVGVGSQVGGSSSSGDEDFDKALEELSAYVDTNLGDADSRLGDETEDLSIEGPGGAGEPAEEPAGGAGGGDDNADEVATKLDLARAYIDMGDTDGARSILEEVMEDGGESHKQEAQSLLDQLQG